jgi:VWFA-related protein
MRNARRGLTAAAVSAAVVMTSAQQQPAQRAQGTVQAGVSAVLVDVVVHDKKGEPVRDLKQGEFQISEDGVAQTIASFTMVMNGRMPLPDAGTASPAPAPLGSRSVADTATTIDAGPTVTALVFDRLGAESRRLAVQAAQNYFGARTEAPGYVGIFGIDLALSPFAPFTRDVRVLKAGLDKMNQRATATSNSKDSRAKATELEQAADAISAGTAAAEASAGAGGANVGTGTGDAMLAQMQANMIRGFDALERDQSGYATTNGLFAIIEQMRKLPGRKSLVFFSEGIALPTSVQHLFEGVTDAANRANVAIYTMDAVGLRAESEQASIRDQVNKAGAGGAGILGGGKTGDGPLSKSLEYNEDVLRQDPRNGLLGLAKDTGGAAFDNTNNLRTGFDRIDSDLRNYYLLGYTPTNDKFDGKFRTISVKVSRPGVSISSRRGYFGLRNTSGSPINTWEAPALGALESRPVPNAFPVRAGALLFPEAQRPGLVPVVVDFKTAPLSFPDSGDGKTYASDFTVLVQFLDDKNNVVKKVGQHYDDLRGPIADVDRMKQGEVVFYREPELPPGVYTMETIVFDTPTGKGSVRFSTVEVPKIDAAALRASSLIVSGRAEKVAERDRRADNPLLVNDVLVYPNLGDPISKKAKEIGFFVTVYPARGGAAPEAVLDLLNNGKALAQVPLPLAAADASGRIQQTGRLPIDQLAPGTYELQMLVKQGTAQVVRTTTFRIVE